MIWVWGVLAIVVLAIFLYWQLIIAEGVYWGQKTVTLLYDWVAYKYNRIKDFNEQEDDLYLAWPLLSTLDDNFNGVILDVATGTGRMPLVLLRQPEFAGTVIGADHSARMLAVARQTLPALPLVQADVMNLPFATNAVKAVTCLEAMEFFPNPQKGLAELVRVLQPGGQLLTTNRIGWEAKLMPGKTWSMSQLESLLAQLPLTDVFVAPWLTIYHQVWAKKKMETDKQ